MVPLLLPDRTRSELSEVIAASDGSKRCGLRKTIVLPDVNSLHSRSWDSSPTPLQLALARGYRWLAMLESGEARSITELHRRPTKGKRILIPVIRMV